MKKKIILTAGVLLALLLVGGGIIFAVKKTTSQEVPVVPVSEMSSGFWGGNMNITGTVTSNASQEIHLNDKQIVDQVFVKEGDTVQVGTALLSFDMTMTSLNLESEKLNKEGLEIKRRGLENEIARLQKVKPVKKPSDGKVTKTAFTKVSLQGGTPEQAPEEPLVTEEEAPQDTPVETPPEVTPPEGIPVVPYEIIGLASTPYQGNGTKEDPFCFLGKWSDTFRMGIKGDFLNKVKEEGYIFRIELHRNDDINDLLLAAFYVDGSGLGDYEEHTVYIVNMDPEGGGDVVDPGNPDPENPGSEDPGNEEPGTGEPGNEDPGNEEPGTGEPGNEDPGTEEPGNEDPEDEDPENSDAPFEEVPGDVEEFLPMGEGNVLSPEEITEGYTKEELDKLIAEKQKELRSLNLDVRQSDLKIGQIEKSLSNQEIKSTVTGIVKSVGDPKKGEVNGKAFLVVESTEGLYVQGALSELVLDQIKEGQTLNGNSYESGIMFDAEIREISPYPTESMGGGGMGNNNVSYYPFTAYIANGTGLKNNEYVGFTAAQETAASDALYLPMAFVREEDGEFYVYRADEKNRLRRQDVVTGATQGGYSIEIKSGLTKEDRIAFPYGKNIKEGSKTKDSTMDALYM